MKVIRGFTIATMTCLLGCAQKDSREGAVDLAQPSGMDAKLTTATENIVSFLSGNADFERLNVADSVDLVVAPEGGGAHVRRSRDVLRDRNEWYVGEGNQKYSFVTNGVTTKMTTKVGTHFRCREMPLKKLYPMLAKQPHVGVLLERPDRSSCLETWNASFVFDTTRGTPRLTVAIYDQWEW